MRIGHSGFVVVLAVLVAACGPTAAPASSVRATGTPPATTATVPARTSPGAATALVFESGRYGYALELPPGWYVRDEAAGEWGPGELSYVGPGTDAFEEDYPGRGGATADSPGVTYGFYVSSADVSGTTTLADWMALLAEAVRRASSCRGEPDSETITIGGERAAALVYDRSDCTADHHAVVLGVKHSGRGYAMTWLAKAGADARSDVLEHLLESFRFTR